MTAEELTNHSWGLQINSLQDLPHAYHQRMMELVENPDRLPYCAISPTFEGFLRRKNEKLIFCMNQRLFIIERQRNKLSETSYHFENIHYMQLGQVLLKGWLLVSGINQAGALVSNILPFNSVTTAYFQPFVDMLRGKPANKDLVPLKKEQEKFHELHTENYKYMNFGRRSVIAGDRVIGFVFQKETNEPYFHLFNRTFLRKKRSLAHLLILTDRELIMVSDDPKSGQMSEFSPYGGIWTYLPLRNLKDTQLNESRPGYINLILELPGLDRIEVSFETIKRQQLESLLDQVNVRSQK